MLGQPHVSVGIEQPWWQIRFQAFLPEPAVNIAQLEVGMSHRKVTRYWRQGRTRRISRIAPTAKSAVSRSSTKANLLSTVLWPGW